MFGDNTIASALLAGLKPTGGDEIALNYWKVDFSHIFDCKKMWYFESEKGDFLGYGPESVCFIALISDKRQHSKLGY
jgi:hypothetical protein